MSSVPSMHFGYANLRERFWFPLQVLWTRIRITLHLSATGRPAAKGDSVGCTEIWARRHQSTKIIYYWVPGLRKLISSAGGNRDLPENLSSTASLLSADFHKFAQTRPVCNRQVNSLKFLSGNFNFHKCEGAVSKETISTKTTPSSRDPTFHSPERIGGHGRVGGVGSVVFVRLFHVLHLKLKYRQSLPNYGMSLC